MIGSDRGGACDVIKHGVAGYLVDPNDSFALEERIVEVLKNPEVRREMGQAGREFAVRPTDRAPRRYRVGDGAHLMKQSCSKSSITERKGADMAGVACIGAGYWGRNLIRNFKGLGALHTICEVDPQTRWQLRDQYQDVVITEHLEEVLANPEISGVAIATGAESHAALVREALLAAKDVFFSRSPRSIGTMPQGLTDHLDIILEGDRVSGYVTLSLVTKPCSYYVRLFCENGSLLVNFYTMTVVVERKRRLPSAVNRAMSNFRQAYQLSRGTIGNVIDSVRGRPVAREGSQRKSLKVPKA